MTIGLGVIHERTSEFPIPLYDWADALDGCLGETRTRSKQGACKRDPGFNLPEKEEFGCRREGNSVSIELLCCGRGARSLRRKL
jgi:hypothetical protein